MRKLDPEERALWQRVAASIRPLDRSAAEAAQRGQDLAPLSAPIKRGAEPRPPSPRALAIGDNLDSSWEKRVRQGSIEPDQTLDLHGYNLDDAWSAIDRILDSAWSRHQRIVLLITGRERIDPKGSGRGRIRAALSDWLAHSHHSAHIAAVRGAHRRHGGPGSLYVILRRR